ncbi:MAG: rod shape-determining protein MreD [Candidatus Azotimanducaceae bacterium]|jgi:rod shape-determining protein MreD
MNEYQTSRVWFMRTCFIVLALVALFMHLLPLSTLPSAWAMPDLLVGFALAWSVRRPDYVPVLLLAIMLLLSDLLLQRPPGLWALLILLCCENLKLRAHSLRAANFAVEWATVAALILGAMLGYRVILAVLLVERPSLGLHLIETTMTILSYPFIVFITHAFMGVRKTIPGDLDAPRGRL